MSKIPHEQLLVFGNMLSATFYKTPQWKRLRYQALVRHGNQCQLCGAKASNGYELQVDHIEPRIMRPDLCLDLDNLQILCESCHQGKGVEFRDDCRRGTTQSFDACDFLRVRSKHLILEHRPPKTKDEVCLLVDGVVARTKSVRKRWEALVRFCYFSQRTYPSARVAICGDVVKADGQLMKLGCSRKLMQTAAGLKKADDLLFDIQGQPFPRFLSSLLVDESIQCRSSMKQGVEK